jgi:hypothetical protein
MRFSIDRDGVDVTLEASFAMAGLGMDPVRLEHDIGAWRLEGTGEGVAMTGAATLLLGDDPLAPERPFPLRWVWRWRSVAGQVAEFDRLVAVARADTLEDDPAPHAVTALARSRALGWHAVLAEHEAAWDARWTAGDIVIEGDEVLQQAVRFAVYHLTSAANPEDDRVSIGARALTGDAYLGQAFWDTEIYLLPFYTARYGPVLGVPSGRGGGWQAVHSPRNRAGRVPRGRGRQRLHQCHGALEHRPRTGGNGRVA